MGRWSGKHRAAAFVAVVVVFVVTVALVGEAVRLASMPRVRAIEMAPPAAATVAGTPEPDLVLVPERHGPYLLVPQGWSGPLEPVTWVLSAIPTHVSADTAEVTRSELWRDPVMPAGIVLRNAYAEALPIDAQGYWLNAEGYPAFHTMVWRQGNRPIPMDVWADHDQRLFDYAEVDGKPAIFWHTPADNPGEIGIRVFDPSSGIEYIVSVRDTVHYSHDDALAIVRSMMR